MNNKRLVLKCPHCGSTELRGNGRLDTNQWCYTCGFFPIPWYEEVALWGSGEAINMGADKVVQWGEIKIAIMDNWIRTTFNPVAPNYHKAGGVIMLRGHVLIPDGLYLVTIVEEFEPPNTADEEGRDIRISLVGEDHREYSVYNGVNIRKAMVKGSFAT